MKAWVLPTLIALRPETISANAFETELQSPIFCWRRLIDIFHHNLRGDVRDLIGSVLADLPRDVFDELVRIRARFIFMVSLGLATRFSRDEAAMIFSPELLQCSWMAGRGTVVHEVAHHFRNDFSAAFSLDDPHGQKIEEAVDAICCQWGFREEIAEIRKYLSNKTERRI